MELVFTLAFMVVWAVLTARMARGRGRRPAVWGPLGAVLGIVAIATLALLPRKPVALEQPAAA